MNTEEVARKAVELARNERGMKRPAKSFCRAWQRPRNHSRHRVTRGGTETKEQ
jgi:hypothetical protein